MFELFQMWALVEILGIACLPLTMAVFRNVADRGWSFTKALALAVFAFCTWFPLMCLHFLPFSQLFIMGVALLLLACGVVFIVRTRHSFVKFVRLNLPYIVTTELVFLGMVFLLGWLRSYGPEIRSYEMYMDEGFVAAIMRSPHFPPSDMWFAGYSINYYYYAHFTIALLAKLLGQTPSIAFNTGICIFFGLTAANLFGVTCNIVSWARHLKSRDISEEETAVERPDIVHTSLLAAVPYGFATIIVGLILGNLAATQQWWKSHGAAVPFYWFGPSRVIDKTINEFPAFSFLLSCFHAHVLALAFTVLAIGLAFNLLLEPEGKGLFVFGRGWRLVLTLGVNALVIGGLFTMNGWDLPTYLGLAFVCIILQQWLAYNGRARPALFVDIFSACGTLAALVFLLYLPFYVNFISPSQGIGFVMGGERSSLRDELLIYGLFAFVFLSLLLASVAKAPRIEFTSLINTMGDEASDRRWSRIGIACVAGFVLFSFVGLVVIQNGATMLICLNIAVAGLILLFYTIGDRAQAFTLLLGVTAFTLVAGCEVFYLRDVFADIYPRMNTVFKFYFQAWVLLSIATGAGLYFVIEAFRSFKVSTSTTRWLRRGLAGTWGACIVLLFLAGMVYPIVAPFARYAQLNPSTHQFYLQRTNSLDGLIYLKTDPANPGDYAAIRWLNANVQGNPGIIEAIGDDYSNYARISAFTGLPAPMGWVGHEYQWRVNWFNKSDNTAEFQRRGGDIDLIYSSPSSEQVLALMGRYHAQYLYVGALEHAKYPTANLGRFGSFMQVVYNANGVTIYRVK
jgi:YYY domain-containing protein